MSDVDEVALAGKAKVYPRDVVKQRGPAVGLISGINHLVLYTRDMEESIVFYRDILGLEIVRSQQFSADAMRNQSASARASGLIEKGNDEEELVRQVFFRLGNGDLLSLYQVPGVVADPDGPIVNFYWPPSSSVDPRRLQKMDHLALNVETKEQLVWFQQHLKDNGVKVSEVIDRQGEHRFVVSIYFSDPSGNPLEIATLDLGNPAWEGYDYSTWFRDFVPPKALME